MTSSSNNNDVSASSPPANNKRQKTDAAARPSPPNYGSKDYWEQRYAKQFQALVTSTKSSKKNKADNCNNDDTTLPYHSWYFTYDELRPILLPILLGGREEARILIEKSNYCGSEEEGEEDFDEEEEDDEREELASDKDGNESSTRNTTPISSDNKTPKDDEEKKGDAKEMDGEDDGEEEEDVEIEEEGGDGGDEEEEEMFERDGLAKDGPVAVLEIGCGDVPLGAALALELKELQDTTGASSNSIVTNITCTDYSQVVVDMMNKQYCTSRSASVSSPLLSANEDGDKKDDNDAAAAATAVDIGTVPLHFVVADARQLPYPDNSFAFILEKGTLDAVLSDTKTGVADCVKIVAECARVASECVVFVSHLNAHTANGLGWLDEVVVAGLNQIPGVIWEIEVHGNSEVVRDDDDDERVPAGTSGPAVYVIHKRAKPTGAPDKPTIPVKFYSY